jgi:hypothetical protein
LPPQQLLRGIVGIGCDDVDAVGEFEETAAAITSLVRKAR